MQLKNYVVLFEVNKQKRNCCQAANFKIMAYALIHLITWKYLPLSISFYQRINGKRQVAALLDSVNDGKIGQVMSFQRNIL